MIPTQPFGRTGHESTRTIFGGAALASVTQDEADHTLDVLLEYGINHIDTAASYGEAELRIGPWMDRYRDRFFLATKTGERTYQKARDEIHRSLERLRVSQVDLLQLHNLVDPDEWETAMGPGGALEAAIEAREQGLVRFLGVTGHGNGVPVAHRRSLERYPFESVLLPYNYLEMQKPEYAANFEAVVAICEAQNVAVQTIKGVLRRPWDARPDDAPTWYEPLVDQAAIDQAVWWVLSRPGVFLNTLADIHILPRVLDAASRLSDDAPSTSEMQQLVQAEDMATLFPVGVAGA